MELARLLGDIRNGYRRFDIVLCWALDRLSRDGAAALLNLVNTFKRPTAFESSAFKNRGLRHPAWLRRSYSL